jgi:hypothetical protein
LESQGELFYDHPNNDDHDLSGQKATAKSLVLVYGGYAPSQLFAQRIEPDHSQAWSVVIMRGSLVVDCAAQDNGLALLPELLLPDRHSALPVRFHFR